MDSFGCDNNGGCGGAVVAEAPELEAAATKTAVIPTEVNALA